MSTFTSFKYYLLNMKIYLKSFVSRKTLYEKNDMLSYYSERNYKISNLEY